MSKKSKKKRGFNQCEVMAKNIGYKLNIPVSNCISKDKRNKRTKNIN